MLTPWGAFAGSKFTGFLVVGERPALVSKVLRGIISLTGCVAGAALLTRIFQRWHSGDLIGPLALFALFQIPFLLIVPDGYEHYAREGREPSAPVLFIFIAAEVYDRYLLFLLPGALSLAACGAKAGTAQEEPRQHLLPALVALGAVGLVSVGLMHDWLAWNSARWELGRRAVARQIEPLDIEGGFEWDGWHAPVGENPPPPGPLSWPVLPFTREWFPLVTGRYALSFSKLEGARTIDSEPYDLWLRPGRFQFFLCELPPLQNDVAEPSRVKTP
jgi:hypothetical protein